MITKKSNVFLSALSVFSAVFLLSVSSCTQLSSEIRNGTYTVTGRISDKAGNPVPDVTLFVRNSEIASATSSDGSYTLNNVSGETVTIIAKKTGYAFIPSYKNQGDFASGNTINVKSAAAHGVVSGADFIAAASDNLTISDIQGTGAESPMVGTTVSSITGVVTMVCYKTPHEKYDTTLIDGTTGPQWISEDGFFMEALPEDKDLSGKKSNGIFVITHDDNFAVSKWKSGFPTDLKEGDVVTVNGTVVETVSEDRFNNSEGYLTRTGINASAVIHAEQNGSSRTAPFPDGVLLTYNQAAASAWTAGHETDGLREARIMPFDDTDLKNAQRHAVDVLETVEDMVVRIDNPLVAGGTYYNLTGILADNGLKDGANSRTWNSAWSGDVLSENDFNAELFFVDYQAPDWTTYEPLAQMGDHLVDSSGAAVFRGVMDYTNAGLYMARPVNPSSTLTSVTGTAIPAQGWNFKNDAVWYSDNSSIQSAMKTQSSSLIKNTVKPWRTGTTAAGSYDADSKFTPEWAAPVTDVHTLTVASFNLENYEAQGGSYDKDKDVALVIKNNLLYPDVIVVLEMGDDVETPVVYDNQANSWAAKDGVVTAVRNFSGIIDTILANGGPRYEFRQIDPKEQDSGGAPGVNIRVGFMYNTERVQFADRGLTTNYYANTHSKSGTLLAQSEWPLQTPGVNASILADASTAPYEDGTGVHLSQSPCYIQSSYFNYSRRPLAGEFRLIKSKDSDGNVTGYETFFVIGCHLSSKMGDMPLYGRIQPPLLLSEVKRDGQGQAVNNFADKILSLDAGAKIIIAGDMNDFAWSTPLRILTGEAGGHPVLWSPAEQFMPEEEQFSYSYEGNLQQIDHIYVSGSIYNSIASYGTSDWKSVCFIPHIDSPFCRNNHINLSDHDPDIVCLKGAF